MRGLRAGLGLLVWAASFAWAGEAASDASVARGQALLLHHQVSGCVLCHRIPGVPSRAEIGPDLAGVASRFDGQALFDRIADARVFQPQTLMPPTLSSHTLRQVAPEWQGKTLLMPDQVHDIVAYLMAHAR